MKATESTAEMNAAIRQSLADRRSPRLKSFHDRHVARLEEKIRRAYLGSDPTASESDFEQALPELRETLRRQAVADMERHRD